MCDLETSRIGAPYIYNVRLLKVKEKIKWDISFFFCFLHRIAVNFRSFGILCCPYIQSLRKGRQQFPPKSGRTQLLHRAKTERAQASNRQQAENLKNSKKTIKVIYSNLQIICPEL